jgi:uncharacterized protein involved in tolerance to divalent cations
MKEFKIDLSHLISYNYKGSIITKSEYEMIMKSTKRISNIVYILNIIKLNENKL